MGWILGRLEKRSGAGKARLQIFVTVFAGFHDDEGEQQRKSDQRPELRLPPMPPHLEDGKRSHHREVEKLERSSPHKSLELAAAATHKVGADKESREASHFPVPDSFRPDESNHHPHRDKDRDGSGGVKGRLFPAHQAYTLPFGLAVRAEP